MINVTAKQKGAQSRTSDYSNFPEIYLSLAFPSEILLE